MTIKKTPDNVVRFTKNAEFQNYPANSIATSDNQHLYMPNPNQDTTDGYPSTGDANWIPINPDGMMIYKGDWSGLQYFAGNVVRYNNGLYIVDVGGSTSNAPDSGYPWILLVQGV